jgi:hypothetical protein
LLSWQRVSEVAAHRPRLFFFGAHAISPTFTDLPDLAAKNEIASNDAQIEERSGQLVEFFDYPFGPIAARSFWSIIFRNAKGKSVSRQRFSQWLQ